MIRLYLTPLDLKQKEELLKKAFGELRDRELRVAAREQNVGLLEGPISAKEKVLAEAQRLFDRKIVDVFHVLQEKEVKLLEQEMKLDRLQKQKQEQERQNAREK